MDTCRQTSIQSSSQIKKVNDEPNITILGSLLSKKSWSNSLHRHLPFNNRWKERYFVVENNEALTVISSGKRIDLSIGKITLSNHDYSPDGHFVLAIAYYTGSNCHNAICDNKFDDKPVTCFLTDHVKELEIQLQFPTKSDMLICHGKLLAAMKFQRKNADRLVQKLRANLSSFLKKKLHIQSILTNTIDAELNNKEVPSWHNEEMKMDRGNSRNPPSSEHLSKRIFDNVDLSKKCGDLLQSENLICGNSSSTKEGYGHNLSGDELSRGVINRMKSLESDEDLFVERDEDDYSIIDNVSSDTTSRRNDRNKMKNNPTSLSQSSARTVNTPEKPKISESCDDIQSKGVVDASRKIEETGLQRVDAGRSEKTRSDSINREFFDSDIWKEGQLEGLSEIFLRSKVHSSPHPSLQSLSSATAGATTGAGVSTGFNLKKVSESSSDSTSFPPSFPSFQEKYINSSESDGNVADDEYRNYRNVSGNMGCSSFFSIPIPKMRILLMSVGTFGDVQPFATLGTLSEQFEMICCYFSFCILRHYILTRFEFL
jgi:hypothetical protein